MERSNPPGIPFAARYGSPSVGVGDTLPEHSRSALLHVLDDFRERGCLAPWPQVLRELLRCGRGPLAPAQAEDDEARERAWREFHELSWEQAYGFIERAHLRLLSPGTPERRGDPSSNGKAINAVRAEFSTEVNTVLLEDGLPFVFVDGAFTRPGREHLAVSATRAQRILADVRLAAAKNHYQKALRFFHAGPEGADYPNAVKEAAVALEETFRGLFPDQKGVDVDRSTRSLQTSGRLPQALGAALRSIFGYRGDAKGVAHAGNGAEVTPEVAELYLSLIASYITYLHGVADPHADDVPF